MKILLKLQLASGGTHTVKGLVWDRLDCNQQDQVQDLYLVSAETGWIKNDESSKPAFSGLVLESGGKNLADFLHDPEHSLSRFGILSRVNILREIVSALEFLECHQIVHGDLKPENIVLFQSSGTGMARWKLIDFDNSYDLSCRPSPRIDPRNTFLTPEYIPPELARAVRESLTLDPTHKMDIWSLGVISIFVLKGHSLWDLYIPFNSVDLSSILNFNEEHFTRSWLSVQVGEKEKSFLEDCFHVEPSRRWNPSRLLTKSLFTTGQATISSKSREITAIRNELVALTQLVDHAVTVEQLEGR